MAGAGAGVGSGVGVGVVVVVFVVVGMTQELPFQEPPAWAQDADISELLDVVVLVEVEELTQAVPSQYCPEVQELLPEVVELTHAVPFQYCPDVQSVVLVVIQ